MIYRIYTDAKWTSDEPGLDGTYSFGDMHSIYDNTVDKGIYPCFEGWLWDMERSATFHRHVMR